ncbi:hypothetical protein DV738_g3474, partial [Chaetothyriales sp. CBS 135597]
MSSSPSRAQPGRKMPKREPLGEITASAANEISARVARAEPWSPPPKADVEHRNALLLSPFPAKPAQVLLPSTVRKQKSLQNIANAAAITSPEPERRPQVRLKRSVKTLRDMYEAQAEEQSRPGTAISFDNRSSRPGTAGSRLRSQSSSDGLSGKYAWEHFKSLAAADELAILPALPEIGPSLRHTGRRASATAHSKPIPSSSPNFRLHSPVLSPGFSIFQDLAELASSEVSPEDSSALEEVESSPNVVRIGPSSSMTHLPPLSELESLSDYRVSDATVISPEETVKIVPPSSSHGRTASTSSSGSRKRKRAYCDAQDLSSDPVRRSPWQFKSRPVEKWSADLPEPLFTRRELDASVQLSEPPVSSSDPVEMQSSPPSEDKTSSPVDDVSSPVEDDSSPVVRVLNPASSSPERQTVQDTHASLQDALFAGPVRSSSPETSEQHPVIRAPLLAQMAGLMVPKRRIRSPKSLDALEARWPDRLSADTSMYVTRPGSLVSVTYEEDEGDTDHVERIELMSDPTNNSKDYIISECERYEGEDEVAALPGDDHGSHATLGITSEPSKLSLTATVGFKPRFIDRQQQASYGTAQENAPGSRESEIQVLEMDPRSTIRPVSLPPPMDPRAHWKDAVDNLNRYNHERRATLSAMQLRPSSSDWLSGGRRVRRPPMTFQQRIGHLRSLSPHLHHDQRLNTSSTASRGFGFPFNSKANQWSAPSLVGPSNKIPGNGRYKAQIGCYLTGFIFPILWFVAAALPLPPRPEALADIEKGSWQRISADVSDWEEFRLQAKAKGEQEVLWQNAKWWRTLNRYI